MSHLLAKSVYSARLGYTPGNGEGDQVKIRVLSQRDVQRALSMATAIEVVKQAFAQLSAGQARVPVRTQLEIAPHEGVTLLMPAYLRESDQLGAKIVSVFPRNTQSGLPTIHALVVVLDARTGCPSAVMDGTYLTALRTGAASGAATDLLAREDTRVAAVFGAGVQGRSQLEAVCEVREITRAWVFDVSRATAEAYAEEMRGRGGRIPADIVLASSSAEAVREADVICTTTTSPTPVFADADLKPGSHINAVGCYRPEVQEIPEGTIQRARLVVDSREACWAEAGDLIVPRAKGLISEESILAELGEIVRGSQVGRESPADITLFKSVGNAVQDVSVAAKIIEAAAEHGLGTQVDL
jgi:alanine dehydrogenase